METTVPGVTLNGRPVSRYSRVYPDHIRRNTAKERARVRATLLRIEREAQSEQVLAYFFGGDIPDVQQRLRAICCLVQEQTDLDCPDAGISPDDFQRWFREMVNV